MKARNLLCDSPLRWRRPVTCIDGFLIVRRLPCNRFRILAVLVCGLICMTGYLDAQTSGAAEFEGKPVESITFSPGPLLDPADLATAQPIRPGAALRGAQVASTIDSLFATGRFADIVVEA